MPPERRLYLGCFSFCHADNMHRQIRWHSWIRLISTTEATVSGVLKIYPCRSIKILVCQGFYPVWSTNDCSCRFLSTVSISFHSAKTKISFCRPACAFDTKRASLLLHYIQHCYSDGFELTFILKMTGCISAMHCINDGWGHLKSFCWC